MSQVSTSYPDQVYSTSNKPQNATLKADIAALELAHNDTDTNAVRDDGTVAFSANQSMGGFKLTSLAAPTAATDAASIGVCWPVGSVYTNKTVATNPAILFGIGTWVAIEGEVVVGYKSGDANFGTPGGAVGEATHILTTAELAAHTHTGPSHTHTGTTSGQSANHTHTGAAEAGDQDGSGSNGAINGGGTTSAASNDHTHTFTTAAGGTGATGSAGSGTAHNNIQPSRICYVWERTA